MGKYPLQMFGDPLLFFGREGDPGPLATVAPNRGLPRRARQVWRPQTAEAIAEKAAAEDVPQVYHNTIYFRRLVGFEIQSQGIVIEIAFKF